MDRGSLPAFSREQWTGNISWPFPESSHHHHGGPSVSRMTLSLPLICGYGSGSAGRSWTYRAVRSLSTGSSHLSLGYRLPSGGVLWRTVLDGDALPLAQMTQIVYSSTESSRQGISPGLFQREVDRGYPLAFSREQWTGDLSRPYPESSGQGISPGLFQRAVDRGSLPAFSKSSHTSDLTHF